MISIVDIPLGRAKTSTDQSTMSERLFNAISNAIIEGEFQSGAILTEPDLANRYGVSRAPLREALRRLEERQLVERSPYRGMRVVEPSVKMIRELYEIREVLEGYACRRAASVITNSDIENIRQVLQSERNRIRARSVSPEDSTQASRFLNFHTMVAQVAGNEELLSLLNREIWRLLRADYRRRFHHPDALRQSHIEHLGILRALGERDADLSDLLMRRHISKKRAQREEAI